MNKLSATFDSKISLLEFNKEVKKLLENFNQNQKLLIEVKIEGDSIIANVKENPNQIEPQRWIWDLHQQIRLNVQDLLAFDFNHYKLLKMFKKYNQSPFWTPKYIPVGKKKIINALIKAQKNPPTEFAKLHTKLSS